MIPPALDELLVRSFDDRHLSRNERQALGEAVAGPPSREERLALSRRAFAIARGAVAEGDARTVLDWLAEVVQVASRDPEGHRAPGASEAHFSPGEACPRRLMQLF